MTWRWAGHIVRIEDGRGAFKKLTGKYMGRIPLGRPIHRWETTLE